MANDLRVVTTNDDGPGSLRQAILEANARPGLDVIWFDLPALGPGGRHTIAAQSLLTHITGSVTMDETTQAGYGRTRVPVVEVSGASLQKTRVGPEAGRYRDFAGLDLVRLPAVGTDARAAEYRPSMR
jgi:hypothetical protein